MPVKREVVALLRGWSVGGMVVFCDAWCGSCAIYSVFQCAHPDMDRALEMYLHIRHDCDLGYCIRSMKVDHELTKNHVGDFVLSLLADRYSIALLGEIFHHGSSRLRSRPRFAI